MGTLSRFCRPVPGATGTRLVLGPYNAAPQPPAPPRMHARTNSLLVFCMCAQRIHTSRVRVRKRARAVVIFALISVLNRESATRILLRHIYVDPHDIYPATAAFLSQRLILFGRLRTF